MRVAGWGVHVSGDSDFVPLVEGITARGTPVCVIGPNGSTAWELKVAATHFVDARDVPGLLEPIQMEQK